MKNPYAKRLVLKCCKAKLYNNEKCRCKEIKIIQTNVNHWIHKIKNLQSVQYNNAIITYSDINAFTITTRANNDINNKKRENIIGCIINNNINSEYLKYSTRWKNLKNEIDLYITKLCELTNITGYNTIQCIHKAGRGHHYDFKIVIDKTIEFDVELKFNSKCVCDTPQFVSPMKPSHYMESSYEEYYYDNYFTPMVKKYNLSLPTREEYVKQLHSPNPKCVAEHQEKYYRGCKQSSKYSNDQDDITFYEDNKKISSESICNFITKYNLEKEKLSEYLLKTQSGKYYMLYKNGKVHLQTINQDDYIITDVVKDPNKNRYIALTKTGAKLKILLRWKNGNGIAYPAFQIS